MIVWIFYHRIEKLHIAQKSKLFLCLVYVMSFIHLRVFYVFKFLYVFISFILLFFIIFMSSMSSQTVLTSTGKEFSFWFGNISLYLSTKGSDMNRPTRQQSRWKDGPWVNKYVHGLSWGHEFLFVHTWWWLEPYITRKQRPARIRKIATCPKTRPRHLEMWVHL